MSIEINNLSLGYQDKLVVKNLSLKFPRNKVIALIYQMVAVNPPH